VVEHSERESHLTPPLDALQWTIFSPVTIQHQNRQIKITSHPRPIDAARARADAGRLSHQTLRGFGSRPISWRGVVKKRARGSRVQRAFSPLSLPTFSRRMLPFRQSARRFSRLQRLSQRATRRARPRSALAVRVARARATNTHTACCRTPSITREARTTTLVNLLSRSRAARDASGRCSARGLTYWQVDSRASAIVRHDAHERDERDIGALLERCAALRPAAFSSGAGLSRVNREHPSALRCAACEGRDTAQRRRAPLAEHDTGGNDTRLPRGPASVWQRRGATERTSSRHAMCPSEKSLAKKSCRRKSMDRTSPAGWFCCQTRRA